jgi:hypothetical protein
MESKSIKGSLVMRTLLASVGSVILTLALLVVTAPSAGAYELYGGKYDDGSIDPISYRFFSVNAAYETAFKDAEAAWDATSAPGYIQEQSWSWDPEINVIDGYYVGDFYAQTLCTITGDGTWDGNEVQIDFNTRTLDSKSAYEKKLTAEHEIGHAYGLDHETGCVIMHEYSYYFTCGGTFPKADDVNGVHAIY